MKSRFTDQSKPFIVWGRFSAMTQIPSARLSTLKPEYSVSNIGSIDRFCLRDSQGARGSRMSSHALEHPFAFLQKRVGRFPIGRAPVWTPVTHAQLVCLSL